MPDQNTTPDPTDSTDSGEATEDQQDVQPLTEDDYAQGETSDPEGASRDVPAGEDYAGSGF